MNHDQQYADRNESGREAPNASGSAENARNHNRDVALIWARAGVPVFPCEDAPEDKNRDKAPLTLRGLYDATTNEKMICEWWTKYPDALPAINVGAAGFYIADLDRHGGPDGVAYFESVAKQHRQNLFDFSAITTSSGGMHLFFRQPDLDLGEKPLGNGEGEFRDHGVNFRGKGGYVIAPGARRADGRQWGTDAEIAVLYGLIKNKTLKPPPQWLVEKVRFRKRRKADPNAGPSPATERERHYAAKALAGAAQEMRDALPGHRNNTLNAIAYRMGRFIGAGWIEREEVEEALLKACEYDDNQPKVEDTMSRAIDAGMDEPVEPLNSDFEEAVRAQTEAQSQAGNGGAGGGGGNQGAASGWPDPKPIPDGLPPVLPWDHDFLPPSLARWVTDISERMQCPPDFVAATLLATLGGLLGNRVGVRPLQHDDWTEVPNLWGVAVGLPGILKTPAMREVFRALKRLAAKARDTHKLAMQQYARAKAQYDRRKKAAERANHDFFEDEPAAPVERRYYTDDATYEKLADLISENPMGMIVYRDELLALLRELDLKESIKLRGFLLKGWTGLDDHMVDRVTRKTQYIDRVCIGLLGSTQPGPFSVYMRQQVKEGGGDGLIQRFGMLVWPDLDKVWKKIDRYPDKAARDAAFAVFERFAKLFPPLIEAEYDQLSDLHYLRFDAEAQVAFDNWREPLEYALRGGDDAALGPMGGHMAKYRKLVPALALICHLADGGTGRIGLPAMRRALAMAKYFESHARRAYGAGAAAEADAARIILERIKKGSLKDGFTARDIYRAQRAGLSNRETVAAALDLLDDLGCVRGEKSTRVDATGKPSITYKINPKVKQ